MAGAKTLSGAELTALAASVDTKPLDAAGVGYAIVIIDAKSEAKVVSNLQGHTMRGLFLALAVQRPNTETVVGDA